MFILMIAQIASSILRLAKVLFLSEIVRIWPLLLRLNSLELLNVILVSSHYIAKANLWSKVHQI